MKAKTNFAYDPKMAPPNPTSHNDNDIIQANGSGCGIDGNNNNNNDKNNTTIMNASMAATFGNSERDMVLASKQYDKQYTYN